MEKKKVIKNTPFRLKESDHRGLKILAAKKGKSIQQLLMEAMDKVFPGWREGEDNEKE